MRTELEEKVALVTGAGQGIGRVIAKALAAEGAVVAINDISRAKVERVVAEIAAGGGQAVPAIADVSQRREVEAIAAKLIERFERIDILVNGARVEPPRPKTVSLEEWWDRTLNVALKGAYFCSMAVLPYMERQHFGRIVNLSSIQGFVGKGDDDWIAYSCAKAGMIGLTRSLAKRCARQGITVNAIAPGYIETEIMETRWSPKRLSELAASVPIGRAGRPEEIADAVLFLAKAAFMTGEILFITGGLSCPPDSFPHEPHHHFVSARVNRP
jgi:3-oxoacyl-[acyl-carrier protein] reductase